jgi:hypothetical protein
MSAKCQKQSSKSLFDHLTGAGAQHRSSARNRPVPRRFIEPRGFRRGVRGGAIGGRNGLVLSSVGFGGRNFIGGARDRSGRDASLKQEDDLAHPREITFEHTRRARISGAPTPWLNDAFATNIQMLGRHRLARFGSACVHCRHGPISVACVSLKSVSGGVD